MKSTLYYVPLSPKYQLSGHGDPSSTPMPEIGTDFANFSLPKSSGDLFSDFLNAKLKTIQFSIQQILDEIESRELLKDDALAQIQKEMIETKEQLLQVAPHGSSPYTLGDSKRRSALEGEIAGLEADTRREESSSWKDIASLKRELRELMREYLEEKRRQEVARG